MVVVQHAGTGGASSGCPLSKEELTVTCLAPLPLKLQLTLLTLFTHLSMFTLLYTADTVYIVQRLFGLFRPLPALPPLTLLTLFKQLKSKDIYICSFVLVLLCVQYFSIICSIPSCCTKLFPFLLLVLHGSVRDTRKGELGRTILLASCTNSHKY